MLFKKQSVLTKLFIDMNIQQLTIPTTITITITITITFHITTENYFIFHFSNSSNNFDFCLCPGLRWILLREEPSFSDRQWKNSGAF